MKRILLSLASVSIMLTALFSACSKEDFIERAAPSETVSAVNNLLAAGQGPYDVLGHGYNVTGEYGNDVSAGFAAIDVAKFKQAQAARLIEESPRTQQYLEEYGENALQYSKMMSRKIEATVGFSFFKSTVSNNFSSSNAFDAKYIYGSYNLIIKQKRYRFNATVDLLKNYLTATFIADLQSKTPQQLVQSYGTHVLVDIYTGAKLDIMFQAETRNQNRENAARAGIKGGVTNIFDLNVSDTVNIKEGNQNFSRKLSYRTRGGDPSRALIGEINLDASTPKISISNWQSSSTPENSVFVDIGQYGLVLLYDLIADATKKAAVKSYIDQYLRDNQVNLAYNKVPVYSMYDWSGGGLSNHVLTLYPQEEYYKSVNEGIMFYAYAQQMPGTVPLYRYFSKSDNDNFFTINPSNEQLNGYVFEKIAFFVFPTSSTGTKPVYRYYSTKHKDHYYTPTNGYIQNYGFERIEFHVPN